MLTVLTVTRLRLAEGGDFPSKDDAVARRLRAVKKGRSALDAEQRQDRRRRLVGDRRRRRARAAAGPAAPPAARRRRRAPGRSPSDARPGICARRRRLCSASAWPEIVPTALPDVAHRARPSWSARLAAVAGSVRLAPAGTPISGPPSERLIGRQAAATVWRASPSRRCRLTPSTPAAATAAWICERPDWKPAFSAARASASRPGSAALTAASAHLRQQALDDGRRRPPRRRRSRRRSPGRRPARRARRSTSPLRSMIGAGGVRRVLAAAERRGRSCRTRRSGCVSGPTRQGQPRSSPEC